MKFGLRIPACESPLEVAKTVKEAEELGFDYAWIPDSQLLWRDPWVTLGAVAPLTKKIVLGTNVTNPITRHSSVTASAAAAVEEISPNRFVLGIGVGDSSVRVMGVKPATIKELRAYIDEVRSLLAGKWLEAEGAKFRLKGANERRIPVYVAGTGPNMLRFAGEIADGVILLAGIAPDTLRFSLDRIAEGASETGRSLADIDIATGLFFKLTDGSPDSLKSAQPYAALYAMRYRDSLPDFAGVIPEVDRGEIYPDIGHAEDWEQAIEMTEWVPQDILELFAKKYCIMGTEDQVLQRVQSLGSLGVSQIYIRAFPSYELPTIEAQAFGRSVIPTYRSS